MAKQLEIRTVYQGEEIILDSGRVNTVNNIDPDPITKNVNVTTPITKDNLESLKNANNLIPNMLYTTTDEQTITSGTIYPSNSYSQIVVGTGTPLLKTINWIADEDCYVFTSTQHSDTNAVVRTTLTINGTTVVSMQYTNFSANGFYYGVVRLVRKGDSVNAIADTHSGIVNIVLFKQTIEYLHKTLGLKSVTAVDYILSVEQILPYTWINGNTVYQCSYQIDNLSLIVGDNIIQQIVIPNANIISSEILYIGNNGVYGTINHRTYFNASKQLIINSNEVWSSRQFFITLRYIK